MITEVMDKKEYNTFFTYSSPTSKNHCQMEKNQSLAELTTCWKQIYSTWQAHVKESELLNLLQLLFEKYNDELLCENLDIELLIKNDQWCKKT
jgi:hypothetical protein